MTDAEAATRLINRHAREVAKALDEGNYPRARSILQVPVKVWLETIAQEQS